MEESLLSRAFDVEDITDEFDPTALPTTGHEYLQHVMYEASKCPEIVVANIDRRKLQNRVDVQFETGLRSGSSDLKPSIEWQQQQIAMFSDLRRKVQICKKSDKFKPVLVPKPHFEEKWHGICFGDETVKLEPSLTLLLSMNEPLVARLLEYQVDWLTEDGLKPNQGRWIYSLLACLDLPLTSETCSCLRDLARKCAEIRCTKTSIKDSDVTALNLIICLVSKYFGQIDLAD